MKLNIDEQDMLEGKQGLAKQRAMELLVKYGEALGAERFIDTNNVHLQIGYFPYPEVTTSRDADELVSKFLLDADERIVVDYVKASNTTHALSIDLDNWQVMGAPESLHELMEIIRKSDCAINVAECSYP